jgi:hypothetical protein
MSLLDCGTVKVYLDDERPTPEGWVRAWWPDEEAVAMRGFVAPNIILHSANPVGRQRMTLGIESIKRLMREREEVEGEEADRGTGVL